MRPDKGKNALNPQTIKFNILRCLNHIHRPNIQRWLARLR